MDQNLAELAKLYGVQTSYLDMHYQHQEADPESVLLVLKSLGAPIDRMDGVDEALRFRREEIVSTLIEPVLLAWDGNLELVLENAGHASLVLEDGTTAPWPTRNLPTGYHKLTVTLGGKATESLVISAPTRACYPLPERSWGIFAPVYSLHSRRSFGAGDLTDFETVADWMQELGGQVAATLPLLANYMDAPYEPGPYSPASRIYWNEFFADPGRAPEFQTDRQAQQLLKTSLPRTELVDYRNTMVAKRRVLESLSQSFFRQSSTSRMESFRAFLRDNPDVSEYARFRAVTERRHAGWSSWPERLRNGTIEKDDYDESAAQYHLYVQWLMHEQLGHLRDRMRSRGGVLYLDLPLGLHADSYDVWRHRDIFVKGMSIGAPPDQMFTTGQNWSLPPMHPRMMRESHHRYMIATIRNHLQYAGLLRIDHVMGLHRLYWIPDSVTGDKGVYVEYPAEELYAILSVESHRNRAGIVGENLGIVPPAVNEGMERHNIRKMYVGQYEIEDDPNQAALRQPAEGSVASLNTHDLAPFRAFMDGADIEDRVNLKFLNAGDAESEKGRRAYQRNRMAGFFNQPSGISEKLFEGCLNFLGKSRAAIVLVNMEDLWEETQPQNVPATTTERPNWRRRMRYSVERLRKMKEAEALLRHMRNH